MIDWLCGSRRGIQLVRRIVLVVRSNEELSFLVVSSQRK